MENKKGIKIFSIVVLCITIVTLLLSIFYNSAFISSCMLMGSLFLFSVCYYVKDTKKGMMYIMFIMGVLLIIGSLGYTFMRISNGR